MDGKLKLLNPYKIRAKEICCSYCSLSYSKEDYKSLFNSRKLIYFRALDSKLFKRNEKICHSCFLALANEEPLSFEIETDNFVVGLEIDPDSGNGGSDDLIDGLIT